MSLSSQPSENPSPYERIEEILGDRESIVRASLDISYRIRQAHDSFFVEMVGQDKNLTIFNVHEDGTYEVIAGDTETIRKRRRPLVEDILDAMESIREQSPYDRIKSMYPGEGVVQGTVNDRVCKIVTIDNGILIHQVVGNYAAGQTNHFGLYQNGAIQTPDGETHRLEGSEEGASSLKEAQNQVHTLLDQFEEDPEE